MTQNAQDKAAGVKLTAVGSTRLPVFDPVLMLAVCERIASGELLIDITKESGMPSYLTVQYWVTAVPEAARALQAARELSADALEEQALKIGREIKASPGTSQKVNAYKTLMDQLRWSAARRNARRWGEQRVASVTVPVTIVTSLPMGDNSAGGSSTEEHPNIYQLEAKVEVTVDQSITNEEQAIVETAAKDPDKPLIPPGRERLRTRVGPQKTVLTPRDGGDDWRKHREELKERKNARDRAAAQARKDTTNGD